MINVAMTASASQPSQSSEQCNKNAEITKSKMQKQKCKNLLTGRLPSKLVPNFPGCSFFVPAVVGSVPMSFLYDTGANLTCVE
jgi:hypothetical protein